MNKQPALFLDRDGVFIENRANYVRSWEDVEFFPQALAALARIREIPHKIVVVTNQSAVGRGIISLETAAALNERILQVVREANGRIDAAAIDSTVWDYLLQQEPTLADKTRLIGSLGPNPSPPLVASEQIPASQRQQLRQLLLTLHETSAGRAILASSGVREFTAVSNHAYQSL